MKKANYLLIAAPAWHNNFMVACDVFEAGKVLGMPQHITATFKEEEEVTIERAANALTAFDVPEIKGLIVSFMHLISIEVGDKVIINDGSVIPYWNKQVRIISTGHEWFMLHAYVKWLGFKVETDEHMYIKSIT